MINKLMWIAIIAVALWGGWELYTYWLDVKNQKEVAAKEAAAQVVNPDELPGMPWNLQNSLREAEDQGPAALKNWLRINDKVVQDPRRAWLELDYCLMITRDNPNEARRLFAEIKKRTPPSSPVYPRIKQLQKTYE
jgi:hypothetical protein